MLKVIFRPINIYTLMWCAYYYKLANTSEGTWLTQLLLGVILVFSLVITVRVIFDGNNPIYIRGLNVLLILFCLYGMIRIVGNSYLPNEYGGLVPPESFLKSILVSILPIYVYYYYSLRGIITHTWISRWSFAFLAIVI